MYEYLAFGVIALLIILFVIWSRRFTAQTFEMHKADFEAECQKYADQVENNIAWRAREGDKERGIHYYQSLIRNYMTESESGFKYKGPYDSYSSGMPSPIDTSRPRYTGESYIAVWAEVSLSKQGPANIGIKCIEPRNNYEPFGLAQKAQRIAEILEKKGFRTWTASNISCPPERHFNLYNV